MPKQPNKKKPLTPKKKPIKSGVWVWPGSLSREGGKEDPCQNSRGRARKTKKIGISPCVLKKQNSKKGTGKIGERGQA